jgi:tripartite-type tricarboxylate transporter receptor subunit TctC
MLAASAAFAAAPAFGQSATTTLAWWGIFAPNNTPPDVIANMGKLVREILSEVGGREQIAR